MRRSKRFNEVSILNESIVPVYSILSYPKRTVRRCFYEADGYQNLTL